MLKNKPYCFLSFTDGESSRKGGERIDVTRFGSWEMPS